jgi:hypothetical protein
MLLARLNRAPLRKAINRIASHENRLSSTINIVKPIKGRFGVGFGISFKGSRSFSIITSYRFPTMLRSEG